MKMELSEVEYVLINLALTCMVEDNGLNFG